MNRAGAVELLMPVVQPAELWQETGRFDKMGPELLRVKDRHERDFIIQPTSRRSRHRHRAPGAAQLPRSCRRISITSRPSSATSAGRASA